MKAINISGLRKRMRHFFDLVIDSSETLIVTRSNEEDAVVLISLQEYNALTETAYLLSTEANRRRLLQSKKEAESGETIPYELPNMINDDGD